MVQYNPDPDIGSWIESIRNNSDAGPNFAPPANWKMVTGSWNTEFKRELNTVKSGIAAIKSPSGASSTAAIETALFPAPSSGLVRAIANLQTSAQGAGFTIALIQYQADQTTSTATTNLEVDGDTDLSNQTVDTWVEMSKGIKLEATTKWCKFKFLRSNATGNVYINDARLINGVITFRASKTTATSAQQLTESGTGGATATILFNDRTTAPNHDVFTSYTAGTGIYLIPRDGIYEFSSQVSTTHTADSGHFDDVDSLIKILVGSTVVAVNYGEAVSTSKTQFKISTGPLSLNKGDQVKVQLVNGSTKTMTVVETDGFSYFTGKQID